MTGFGDAKNGVSVTSWGWHPDGRRLWRMRRRDVKGFVEFYTWTHDPVEAWLVLIGSEEDAWPEDIDPDNYRVGAPMAVPTEDP